MSNLFVDANSIYDRLTPYFPVEIVNALALRIVYMAQQRVFPDNTVVILDKERATKCKFNNVHVAADTIKEMEELGLPDCTVVSYDPEVLALREYEHDVLRPTDDFNSFTTPSLQALKKLCGLDPRDMRVVRRDVISGTPERKSRTAAGKSRHERWGWAEGNKNTTLLGWTKLYDNIHVKVGRSGFNNFEIIQDVPDFLNRLDQHELVGWDTETKGLDWTLPDMVVGESFSFDAKHGFYLPIRHVDTGSYQNIPWQQVVDQIHPVLATKKIAGANLSFDVLMCHEGMGFPEQLYDVQGYAYQLGMHVPDPSMLGLKALSKNVLGSVMEEYEQVARGDTFDLVPISRGAPYAADDAVKSLALHMELKSRLESGQAERYESVYMPLLWACIHMSYNGMYLDTEALKPILENMQQRLEYLQDSIQRVAGYEINLNSPTQMQKFLFEQLGLPPTKQTKSGGMSTAADALEAIEEFHPVITDILEFRTLDKLIGTYLGPFPSMIKEKDGRLHSSLNPFKAITGRITSNNPNLMNIPIRGERGREVRGLFSGQGDNYLLSADAGQLEYRVLAHFSNNPVLIEAFSDESRDIHREMAAIVFGKDSSDVSHEERSIAKTVFYAILYGARPPKIASELGSTVAEAAMIMSKIRANVPEIEELRKAVLSKAYELGYVESLGGHRTYVYGLRSRESTVRQNAERTAFDALMQGTGSGDITAVATFETQRYLYRVGSPVKMVMQIHDELLLEGTEEQLREVSQGVIDSFSMGPQMQVPVVAESKIGKRWSDIH